MKLIKKLSGHSGCGLKLYKKDGLFFVRKDAGKKSYNPRLIKQFIKQNKFSLKGIRSPEIIHYGKINDIFYFDMEFIRATTLADVFKNIKINEIEELAILLFKSLQIKNQSYNKNANLIFQNKIKGLDDAIKEKTPLVKKSFAKLMSFDFNKTPHSQCHGDLTLENIMFVNNKELYLIDFLDSFYDSWMIDVAKLLQDLEFGWSYRYQDKNFNLNLRLNTAKGIILTNISSMEKGLEYLLTIYHILLLNILRIIPYTKDEETKTFLENALEKNLNIINEMEKK